VEKKIRLSEQFLALALECEQEVLTVIELVRALGVRGHAFMVLILSTPFILPVPMPGLSMAIGIFIMFAGFGIAFGWSIWLPKWLMRRSLPGHVLARAFRSGARFIQKTEKILKPRWLVFSDNTMIQAVAGVLISISGLVLALPLPPGTNFPPATVIILLSLGILERDGVFLLAGLTAFLLKSAAIVGLFVYARPWVMQWLG